MYWFRRFIVSVRFYISFAVFILKLLHLLNNQVYCIISFVNCLVLHSGKYVVVNGLLQLIIYTKEKNAILFTHPLEGSFTSTGLVVSSKLPRFSDLYTLTIASADPESISANKPVELTKSVTKWFTKDGVLVEGLFWRDVEGLVSDYGMGKEPKKTK
ncbi:hypothetical protein QQ045_033155 [Rhodiola kirilowii]